MSQGRLTKLVEHSSDSGESSRWKIAVALGVPLAVVSGFLLYWYWRSRRRGESLATSAQSTAAQNSTWRTSESAPAASPSKSKEKSDVKAESSTTNREETVSPLKQARDLKAQGNALYKAAKYEEAIRAYEEAIRVCPPSSSEDIAVFHQNIAAVYAAILAKETDRDCKVSHLQSIVDHCSKALEWNPKYVKALSRRVKAFEALGKNRECLMDFTRVALLDKAESKSLAESMADVIKAVGKELSDGFTELGPLSPPKYLVKSFFEYFVWKDDLSDARLQTLWTSTHTTQPATDQPTHNGPVSGTTAGDAPKEGGASDDATKEGGASDDATKEGGASDDATKEGGASGDATKEGGASGDATKEGGASGDATREGGGPGDATKEGGVSGDATEGGGASGDATKDGGALDDSTKVGGASSRDIPVERGVSADTMATAASSQPQGSEANPPDPLEGYAEQPFVKAVQLLRKDKLEGIIKWLTEAISGGDAVFIPHALLLRAAMYSWWRQDELALVDYDAVINFPGLESQMYSHALVNKANVLVGLQDLDHYLDCFTLALKVDPSCTDAYIHRAKIVMESESQSLEAVNGAIADLEKAVGMAPDHSYCHYRLAAAYHRLMGLTQSMQLLESVRSKFEKAYKRFPSNAEGLVLYAMFLQDLQEYQKAEEILKNAVKMEPSSPLSHFALGLMALLLHQDGPAALQCMEAAISVDSSCVQAYDTMASLELQRGNSSRAMELYEKAIKFARTKAEMAQACIAKELIAAQERARIEFGISAQEMTESFREGF